MCLCLLHAISTDTAGQFLCNQTAPLNSVAKFTCRTASLVVWQIDNLQLSSDSKEYYHMRGIRVDSANQSVLLVDATLENNEARIFCVAGPNRSSATPSRTAVLIVFGE